MKAYIIPSSFLTLLLLTACSTTDHAPKLLAQSAPSTDSNLTQENSDKKANFNVQDYITQSQQQAADKTGSQSIGEYKSAMTAGLTTTLQLNADHTAMTRYDYQNGDQSLTETGYWQQIDNGQLNVLVTAHDNKPITSIRLYTINGTQLTAHKEFINGMKYDLGTNGLTLEKVNK